MPFADLTICGRSQVRKVVKRFEATHVLSIIDPTDRVVRPHRIAPANFRVLRFDDVADANEPYAPTIDDVRDGLTWGDSLPEDARLVVHCTAGVSRSTAMAYGLLLSKITPDAAMKRVMEIRPEARPNELMMAHLATLGLHPQQE